MKTVILCALSLALAFNLLAVAMNPYWEMFALTSAAIIGAIYQIVRR
jgi:hypothetical protein